MLSGRLWGDKIAYNYVSKLWVITVAYNVISKIVSCYNSLQLCLKDCETLQ